MTSTTTIKFAERVLASYRVLAVGLPSELRCPSPMSMLLELYVAEEEALYPTADGLGVIDAMHPNVRNHWIKALVQSGHIEQKGSRFALSDVGYKVVNDVLDLLFQVQRCLD
ncbi:hypothetical protein [Sphingomonas abaci]|uniref:Uncharacterized protein n=1 Tax=Sphingomonas abaci TaxID=237611 RepID=A0A7W7AKL1_9SPHN|nr:hypothetical protein [Sphingomonas abaci]MBB4618536.1 hypothetical protein [Sphingomonas abaci]